MQKWLIPILGVKYERKLCRIVDIYIVTLFAYAIINKMLLREHDILSPCILKPEFQKKVAILVPSSLLSDRTIECGVNELFGTKKK